ncbi:MAG: UvrD-helicase domain-containing protein, partial [SAR324 cluster bacterium]|nr:UvrD-helicase domain-containing protein [SAR324 cluster bacterium]
MTEQPSIADAALRERALDASRSFIVQAPAGSGKTELLIQRLLVLLAQVDEPEQVVAITFTRKAAGEMRARLLDVLTRAGEGEGVGAQNAGSVHELDALRRACAVVQRDRVRGWKLLEAPARLRIQTIDSFSAALARQHPVVSGLGGQPAVSEDSMPLYRGAAQATLALLEAEGTPAEASARLLRHLDNDHARAEGLLCTMLARRDQWLRHLAGAEDLTRLRHRLEAALQAAIRDALRAARAALERQGAEICPHLPGELPLLARYAAAQVRDLQIDSPVARLADLRGLPGTAASDHPAWNGLAALLTTQKGEWRKTLTRNDGFPTDKLAGDGHTQAEMKRRTLALLGDLARAPDLAAQLRGLCALPPPTYDEGQWAVLEALLSLLPQAVARLREEFAASGRVDYVEVALAALRTLEGGEAPGRDAPGDAAGLTEANIRHVLVDEFQDTSHTQFRLLERLTAGWPADGSHTLFLV